jgi:uncharacterized protein
VSDDLNLPGTVSPEAVPGKVSPPMPAPPEMRESPLREVFVGPGGLRAGTRVLLYLAMAGAVLGLLGVITHFIEPYGRGKIWMNLATEIQLLLAATIPGFLIARFEKRPFGDYGLPSQHAFGSLFWKGMGWGILWITVLILMLRALGGFQFGTLALHGVRVFKFAAYYAVFFLAVGFFEEFLLRGYSQYALAKGIDFWPAAAVLSTGFGAIHAVNPGETRIGLVAAGLIGFFFCLTLRRTGNLWFAVGFHCSWDWGETYFYSVPDSGTMAPGHLLNSSFHGPAWLTGGPVGPEGSVLAFAVIIAMWLAFDRMYPAMRYRS